MVIEHRQITPYGCGMYAVAHALNLPSFVTEARLQESKPFGNTNPQLNRWLREDGCNWSIECLYYNSMGKKLPVSLNQLIIKPNGNEDIVAMPLLIQVRYSETGLTHMISAKMDLQGFLWIQDSLKQDVKVTTMSRLNSLYPLIFGVWLFMAENGDYIFIHR